MRNLCMPEEQDWRPRLLVVRLPQERNMYVHTSRELRTRGFGLFLEFWAQKCQIEPLQQRQLTDTIAAMLFVHETTSLHNPILS